jgi:quinol monooxygenase YgiN
VIIIAGHLIVDPAERDAAVAAHRDLVARARTFDGCLHVAITADSVDDARINNIEVWRDADALDRWRGQADAPDTGAPRHVDMQRYDATDGGPLFGPR